MNTNFPVPPVAGPAKRRVQKREKAKRLPILLMAALFPTLILLSSCDRAESGNPQAQEPVERRVQVSVVTVEPTPIRDVLLLPGETEAWEDVRVASDMTGQVEWLGAREGEAVKKGQLLAKIDVSALEASLDRSKASLKLAEDLYKRRESLFEKELLSQEERNRSLTERSLAEAALRMAQVEYDRGFLHAPINGVVNHLFVDAGEYIEKGKPMIDLVNVDQIKINANVPELDVGYFRVGQKAHVSVDALPGRSFEGVIDFVAYKADPATKTFLVRVLIDNAEKAVRPGMIARVAFLRRVIPDALTAPLFSLVDKSGERLLFVEKEGVSYARTVQTGIIEGDRIQITSGLEAGDRLIVRGQTEVEEGMKVLVQ
jgi:membrane fusion protein, multidrug efflux system